MANPEHVALVRQGPKAIAEWREAHPEEQLDLSGADLSGTILIKANLSRANLSGANLHQGNLSAANLALTFLTGTDLTGAKLSGATLILANLAVANLAAANLSGAILRWANVTGTALSEANLSRADLSGAILYAANLTRAKLTRARLRWANLSSANLRDVDMRQAVLGNTVLGDADLSHVVGLASVDHVSPSSIGVDTLVASVRGAGNKLTPEMRTFFLGAGVPPELLNALPDIVREVKHYSCFISYGQADLKFAEKLLEDLKARSVSCWLWERDKTVGKPTWGEIEQKLDEYERIVVLCSIKALIREGFKKEIDKQIDKNPDKLIPVSLDDDWKQHGFKADWAGRDLKTWLLDRNYADFANKPYEEELEALLKGLRRP